MSKENVRYTKSGATAYLTLNRPHKRNAIDLDVRDALWTYLQAACDDPDLQVLCIGGAGDSFCAGADIRDFGTAPSLWAARQARHQRDLWWLLEELPCITIAALHGYCYGAGIELAPEPSVHLRERVLTECSMRDRVQGTFRPLVKHRDAERRRGR